MKPVSRDVTAKPGPAMLAETCFHCGLPVPTASNWRVEIDGITRNMCCPGCQAVAQTIVDSGCTDYYRDRTALPGTASEGTLVPPQLRLYDSEEGQRLFAPDAGEGTASTAGTSAAAAATVLSVEGIRCAACVWLIEKRLAQVPGVLAADMNVATERLHVQWRPEQCQPSDILGALHGIGYAAYPYDPDRHAEKLRRESRTLNRRLFIAGLAMMQVMMYAVPAYMATDGTLDEDMAALLRWASLVLTLPAVVYSAVPFVAGAWRNLRQRVLGMDVPIALGIIAGFAGSCWSLVTGRGDVYFDSVTMFIFLLLCSRSLELGARRKAAASLERLQHALPASANRLAGPAFDAQCEVVSAAALAPGDYVLVKPGETFAADSEIVSGATRINLSLLTGESEPVACSERQAAPGGALNVTQPVIARVTKPLSDSTLAMLLKLIERAGAGKPNISMWADRVASWFVLGLLVLAIAAGLVWSAIDATRAIPIAVAILVVSCPCALSLATPTALAAGTDSLLAHGVLITQAHVLETLHRATMVVFDKTGTLTEGRPELMKVTVLGAADENSVMVLGATLDAHSAHPLAQALCRAADERGVWNRPIGTLDAVGHTAGMGMEGVINGQAYRLGNLAFVAELAGGLPPVVDAQCATRVWLATSGSWLACFEFADRLRDGAVDVVAHFQQAGKRVVLLSGDAPDIVAQVGRALGVDQALGGQSPDMKYAFIANAQAAGERVCMVGDGINDAAVLKLADVSFAMSNGSPLAQVQADAVLLSDRIGALLTADRLAAATMGVIRQNLAWATLYNIIAIPAAAVGWLNPWMSSVGMSLSSAIVVINALRLRRFRRVDNNERHRTGAP